MTDQIDLVKREDKPTFHMVNEVHKRTIDYVKSPFRYPGGKYYALPHILPIINSVPHDEFREPFVGGGTIFFAKAKSRFNWLNDLEADLITTYQVIADEQERKELARRLADEVANRHRHAEIKNYIPGSRLDTAFKTFYLNRTSYSGIINLPAWGYVDGKSAPPQSWVSFIEEAGSKLQDVCLTTLDFEPVVQAAARGEKVFMYLDPPYYHADQKRAYTKPFNQADHLRLAKLLHETDYLFCLSYDDCEEIRELYAWAEVHEYSWLYNTANKRGEKRKLGNELVITNFRILRHRQQALV